MRPFMQAGYRGVRSLGKAEAGNGPDGVQFRFAIDQVLEIGRDFQVLGDRLESFG